MYELQRPEIQLTRRMISLAFNRKVFGDHDANTRKEETNSEDNEFIGKLTRFINISPHLGFNVFLSDQTIGVTNEIPRGLIHFHR